MIPPFSTFRPSTLARQRQSVSTLTGSDQGNNTFQLGGGAETATGGRLGNIYQASSATGQAQIILPSAATSQNELDFTGTLSNESLWFKQFGNDLTIDLLGASDNVTVKNFFGTSGSHMQEITAGGLKIDSGTSQLVQAMAVYANRNSGFNPTAISQAPNDTKLQSARVAQLGVHRPYRTLSTAIADRVSWIHSSWKCIEPYW